MGYAALDTIDDAIDATKSFLLPFELGTWLRLAVVMIFVAGGGGGLNAVQNVGQFGGDGGGGPTTQLPTDPGTALPDEGVVTLIIGVVAIVVLFVLVLSVISAIMEFVFVRSLFDREVHVRRYFSRNLGNGFRLFVFKTVVGLIGFGIILVPLALLFFGLVGGGSGAATLGVLTLLLPVVFLVAIVSGLINGLTSVFVVPVMLAEERGLLSAWGRVWGAIRTDFAEFAVYVVMSVLLGIGVGIVAAIGSVIVGLLIGIPFAIVAFTLLAAVGSGVVSLVVFAVLGIAGVLLFLLLTGLVQAPLQSFLRYYALLVLGDVAPELDPIPEIRAGIRDEDGDPSTASV